MSKGDRPSSSQTIPTQAVGPSTGDGLLLAVTVPIAAVVMIFVLVTFSPDLFWDITPEPGTKAPVITSLGPASLAWLSTLVIGLSAMAILAHTLVGGRVHLWPTILLGLGTAACLYHMPVHAGHLVRAGPWCAAAAVAMAIYHLAQHDRPRALMIACFSALAIPMFFRAVAWVFIEHPATVQAFTDQERTIIESRGWGWESAQHLAFRRRTLTQDYIGAVSLSNVQGTLSAAMAVLAMGMTLARRKLDRITWLWMALAVVGGATLLATRSRGAMLAAMLVGGLVLLGWWVNKRADQGAWQQKLNRAMPVLAVMLVVLAFGAVLVRGWMGPPSDAQGERSLLFRYHYWQAAGRLMIEGWPARTLLGIGPGRFQELSAAVKNPLNPEDVESAHNVQVDYVTTLGVGGLAWSVLLVIWLMQASRLRCDTGEMGEACDVPAKDREQMGASMRGPVVVAGVLALGLDYALRWPTFSIETALLWMAGLLGFIAAAISLAGARQRWVSLGLMGAAGVLLVHSQIEMAYFQTGSSIFAWALMALAAGSSASWLARRSLLPGLIAGALTLGLAGVMVVLWALPVSMQQQALAQAAQAMRDQNPRAALEYFDQAITALPTDPAPYNLRAQLLGQFGYANLQAGHNADAQLWFTQAIQSLDQADHRGVQNFAGMHLQAQLLSQGGASFKVSAWRERAITIRQSLAQHRPYHLTTRLELADALWDTGRRQEAADQYRIALQLSEQNYLDPLMMMPIVRQQQVRDRIQQAGHTSSQPGS